MKHPTQRTPYKDHTGRYIKNGDKCEMDAGHAHCDDWKGSIELVNGHLSFCHDDKELGNVPVSECFSSLEVIV